MRLQERGPGAGCFAGRANQLLNERNAQLETQHREPSRALLNLFANALHAVRRRLQMAGATTTSR